MSRNLLSRLRRAFARANRRVKSSDGLMHLLLSLRKALLYLLVVVFLIFEEVWEVLRDFFVWSRYYRLVIARVNGYCSRQNRYVVLLIYLSLFLPMELLGLASAALMAGGYVVWGVVVYLSKGLIAIPAIDIFVANKEKLLSFSFVRRVYELLQRFKQSDIYRSVVQLIARMKW